MGAGPTDPPAPPGVDLSVPSIARVYDYVLGGKDNFPSDRDASQAFLNVVPDTPLLARDNRSFLRRAVQFLVRDAGIEQIIDIGSGLPTVGNVHQIAQEADPGVRVVYVDIDPIVLVHGRALLAQNANTTVIVADLLDPASIFEHADTRRLIDTSKPLAVLMASILHHLADDQDPVGVAGQIKQLLPSGSYLLAANFYDDEDDARAPALERAFLDGGLGTGRFRRFAEQIRVFDGLELVEPGLVYANDWRPDLHTPPDSPVRTLYAAGVARKP